MWDTRAVVGLMLAVVALPSLLALAIVLLVPEIEPSLLTAAVTVMVFLTFTAGALLEIGLMVETSDNTRMSTGEDG